MHVYPILISLAAACLLGCDGAETQAATAQRFEAGVMPLGRDCEVVEANMALPPEVPESSGLARSARDPDRFWTHNDAGNAPRIYAVDAAGQLVQQVRVTGAEMVDWEDIEVGPCGGESCLFVGDIGDNDGERSRITIYRFTEPAPGAGESEPAAPLHARFPDGPRDAEALFVGGAGDLFVVTKGRRGPVGLYRYPSPHRAGEVVTLEHVRDLLPEPGNGEDRVTAASATPDGRRIGVRTYRTLYLYPAAALVSGDPVDPTVLDLSGLDEAQGEALVLANDGSVWLSSEAEGKKGRARWSRLRCPLGG